MASSDGAMSVLPISSCCYTRGQIASLASDVGPLPKLKVLFCVKTETFVHFLICDFIFFPEFSLVYGHF